MDQVKLASITMALALALAGASAYHLVHKSNDSTLRAPPEHVSQNEAFLMEFQNSDFDHEQRQTIYAWAKLPLASHRDLVKNMSALTAERRWFVTSRQRPHTNTQLYWLAVPAQDADILRRIEADIEDVLNNPPQDPATSHPDPDQMLSAKLTVHLTYPSGAIALFVCSIFAAIAAAILLLIAIATKPVRPPPANKSPFTT